MLNHYFLKLKSNWLRKFISILSAVAIIFSVIAVPLSVYAEATTEKMFVIKANAAGETKCANVIIPLDFREVNGEKLSDGEYFLKLTFKLKLLGDSMPIVGRMRYNPYDNKGTYAEPYHVYNGQSDVESKKYDAQYCEYDEETLTYTTIIRLWLDEKYCGSSTGAHTAITIGNAEHNGTGYKEKNFDASFAFASPELYLYDPNTKTTSGENLIAEITEENFNSSAVYKHTKDDYAGDDQIIKAPVDKWSIDTTPSLISLEDIPEGYFSPSKHQYTLVPMQAATRDEVGYKQHYVCSCEDCVGKYFLDKGITEVTLADLEIPPIGEDKIIIVSPNVDGAKQVSNIFIPLNFREVNGEKLSDGEHFFKLTFKLRTFGDSLPIVGRIRYNPYDKNGSYSEPNHVYNGQENKGYEALYYEYDEETLTYTTIIRTWLTDSYCGSSTGAHTAITIGNAEHNGKGYKENNFDASFAFSNPELYYYDQNTGETVGENLIAPIAESTVNLDQTYKHPDNDYNGADQLITAPVNIWSIDGDKSLITLSDYPKDYFTPGVHDFVEHPAKEATETEKGNITYFTCECESCAGKYYSDHGFTEIKEEDIFTTKKMIVISPNASGGTKFANVFIPLNFRESGGVEFNEDNYYFKLTFKVKLLGNSLPIVGVMRYNPYDNLGSYSEPGKANNGQRDHDDKVIYTDYDPETMIFTAVVKTWINDKYSSSPTGAHTAITIGNAEHNGNWYSENNFDTTFAFCDPKLYAYDATTGETYGENLMADITDSSFNADKVYKHTENDYAGDDNIMSAPANMWSVDGQGNMVTLSDIPADYFIPVEGTPNMIIFAGSNDADGNGDNGKMLQNVALEADKSYRLSYNVKYASQGVEGDKIGGELQYTNSEGLQSITAQKTISSDEYKEIFDFTMPNDAVGGKNFIFTFNYSSAFTSGYMANFELYEVDADGNITGKNLFKNGDFSIGGTATWTKQGSTYRFVITEIPENFFNKVTPVKSNMIIYRNTTDYAQFFQMLMIKPSTTYEFTHTALHTDYASDKKPYSIVYEFFYNDNGAVENGSIASDRIVETTDGAKTTMIFTTKDNLRVTDDNNAIFRLYMRSDSAGYWGPVELYELDADGNRVGNNILLNGDFLFGTTAWSESGDKTTRIVEIPDNFFENYKEPEQMVYSNGQSEDQTYSSTVQVSADKKHYFFGYYVNMNSVGVTPQIQYLSTDGTYKDYSTEVFYDSSRYYFEIEFEAPSDAMITDGLVTLRAQINNLNKGKGYFTDLMLTEEGKHQNLISDFAYESNGNYELMKYDSGVFIFYYDDEKFDDGDWSGELSNNIYDIKYGTVSGRLVDSNGSGIKDRAIKLMPGNISIKTDENGTFFFDNLNPGEYKLYVVQDDNSELFCLDVNVQKGIASLLPNITYYIEVKTVEVNKDNVQQENVEADKEIQVDADVPEYGILRGYYYTKKGKTISGGKIFLRGYGSVVTDKSGMFIFENVEPGEHELYTVLEDGKEYVFRTVNIEANKGIQVKIMEPIIEDEESTNSWIVPLVIGASVVACAGVVFFVFIIIKKKKAA